MCLQYNSEKTEHLKVNGEKEFYVYKYFKEQGSQWVSPYMYVPFDEGWNISNRESKNIDEKEIFDEISLGIHVYLNTYYAKISGWEANGAKLFKVKVLLEDLVAVGRDGDAVFMKIFFDSKEKVNET